MRRSLDTRRPSSHGTPAVGQPIWAELCKGAVFFFFFFVAACCDLEERGLCGGSGCVLLGSCCLSDVGTCGVKHLCYTQCSTGLAKAVLSSDTTAQTYVRR